MHTSINYHQNLTTRHSDSPDLTQQKRLANFLSLANLKQNLPKELFQEVESKMNNDQDMPQRRDWYGLPQNCSFGEYDLISGLASSPQLPILLANQQNLSTKISQFSASKGSVKQITNPLKNQIEGCHLTKFGSNCSRLAQISNFKNRNYLQSQFSNQITHSKTSAVKSEILNQDNSMFHRMKTVFGHAIIAEGSGTPIYNCLFDQSGKYVITGADDGIIKVWNKDNMVLQASLHGHKDVIIYITVSNCNRFMASASKEGTLILWDLENCTIIKRLTEDHTSQINNLKFIMMECNQRQATKNLASMQQNTKHSSVQPDILTQETSDSTFDIGSQKKCYDQFLVSCSDDGFIIIFDCSSFTQGGSDEFYLKSKTNNMYESHQRNKVAINQDDMAIAAQLRNIIPLKEGENEDPEDKIHRKTRKRRQGLVSLTNQTTANSSSQSQPNTQQIEIFRVKLRSDDFRAGTRNKHIDSFSVNCKGFVAGGTNHGEIYLWKVNFDAIRSKKQDGHYQWINSFKVHKKANHYLSFNPAGDVLLCGSADGTTCLYDTSFVDKYTKVEPNANEDSFNEIFEPQAYQDLSYQDILLGEQQLIYRFEEKSDKHELVCAIDCANWSCNGRYAICATNIKKQMENSQDNKNNKQAIVKIKVYDTVSGKEIKNLNKTCGYKNTTGFACTMKSHPFNDDILIVCYDGGINILYDIRQQIILQEIVEYGIYSIDQFTMNNQMDVDFSSCGDWLAFSSIFGTTSLYTTQAQRKIQYQCTRVQQFFPYDNENHDKNVFETLDSHPQLCGYELNPYEVQPTPPVIGKFNKSTPAFSAQDFYKQQLFAKEFAIEEENFYMNQLKDGMRQGYFENNPSLDAPRNDDQDDQQRLFSSNRQQPNNMAALLGADMYMESDDELIGGTRAIRERRAARLGNARRTVIRNDENPEDIDESALDESFKDEQTSNNQLNVNDDYDDDDDFASLQSDENKVNEGRRISESPIRRENYHLPARNIRRQAILDQDESEDDEPRQQRLRVNARQIQGGNNSQSTNQSGRQNQRNRQRLRQVIHSGQTSQFEDRPDDQSDFANRRPTRNNRDRQRNARRTDRINLMSSDEQSANDNSSEESEVQRGRNRSSRQRVSSKPQYYDEDEDDQIKTRNRNKQARKEKKDNIEMTEEISVKSPVQVTEEDLEIEETITVPSNAIDRDDTFSIRASKSKPNVKVAKQPRFVSFPKEKDEDYIIDTKIKPSGNQSCGFCQRQISASQSTGPFVRNSEKRTSSQENDEPIYFHRECLEVNQYVRYNDEECKWINIGYAIKNLSGTLGKKSYNCYRCFAKGATIQCSFCDRAFHGHYCSGMYTLEAFDDQADLTYHICIFCKSNQNYIELKIDTLKFAKLHINDVRQEIPRTHLVREQPFKQTEFYLPQIGDSVRYFWQGHEKFYQCHNCYFYSGNQKNIASTDLPWLAHPELKNIPSCQVGCEVVSISHKFPKAKSEYLIDLYGETSFKDVNQKSQIITYLELKLSDTADPENELTFIAPIFPNEVAHYIVPDFLYMKKFQLYQLAKAQNKLIGKRFKTTKGKGEVQVISVGPCEPDYAPESHWEAIFVKDISNQSIRPSRGRGSPSPADLDQDTYRLNFWELIYPEEATEDHKIEVPKIFEENETQRMMDAMTLFFNRKPEACFEFLERVGSTLVVDYKSYVSVEMWLQLIYFRLQNFFYRSQDQLWFDLDLVTHCSFIYNGEDDELTIKARGCVEKIRKELKNMINQNHEKKIQQQKAKQFTINNEQENLFGFTDISVSPVKNMQTFNAQIGRGGIDIKAHLDQNLDRTVKHERVEMVEAADGSNSIIIDFNAPIDQPEQKTLKKGRGRPKKNENEGDFDFTITIDQNEGDSDQIADNEKPSVNKRKHRRDVSDEEDSNFLGKRSFNQFINPESSSNIQNPLPPKDDGSLSNQENRPINTHRNGVITIDLNDNASTRRSTRLRKVNE